MAGDRDLQLVPGTGSDRRSPLDDEPWHDALSDDGDSLEALRRVWLATDDGSDADAIMAATQPLGPAQQEQIVQRLLRERERERSEPSPIVRRLRSLPRFLQRTPLWSVAAACALCCVLAARVPHGGDASNHAAPTVPHPVNQTAGQKPHALSPPTSRDPRGSLTSATQARSARGGDARPDLAETYARRQRFEEAEALRAFAVEPPFAVF